MTDQPERDKVEEIQKRHMAVREAESFGLVGANQAHSDRGALLSLLSLSEKRAEEMEEQRNFRIGRLTVAYEALAKAESERDSLRSSLARVVEAEREECAKIALAIDSGRGNEKEIARAIRVRSALHRSQENPIK